MPSSNRVLPFALLVSVAGAAAAAMLVAMHGMRWAEHHPVEFAVLCTGVVFSELLPLKVPRRGTDQDVTVSMAFSFALLLMAGVAPAVIALVVASVLQDLEARKAWWRASFNAGQYALSLAAAWLVMATLGHVPDPLAGVPFTETDLPLVMLGAATFFAVNNFLVGSAAILWHAIPLRQYVREDVRFSAMTNGVLLCFAPVIVTAADFSLALVPLFAVPLLALHRAGRQSVASAHAARHDSLTGLANRAYFRQVGEDVMRGHEDERWAVLLMDLDRFKEVNDTLGHHAGDLLLQAIAERLNAAVPEAEVIARLGGDEFALLLPPAVAGGAAGIADRISYRLGRTIEVGEFVVEGEASIGIAVSPENGTDIDTLLRRADVAMYRAKSTHKAWSRYDEEHDHNSPAKLALMGDLRRAIDNGEIVVWYQPSLDLRTGNVAAVEALVRWEHPRLGMLPPSAFLSMAEHTSLIKPLTRRVLEDSMLQVRRWAEEGLDLVASVNVSMRSLLDPEFPAQVRGLLSRTGVPARRIRMEITESTIMADPRVVRSVLDQLGAMGIGLSIDDFGTGYSSLAYLRDLPVDEVKIDRSFVSGMADGTSDQVIVRSVIDLGHHLGLQVVAEGVEDEDTLRRLAEHDCDRAQGYWISRPLPANELAAWAKTVAGGHAELVS